jgi:hypothetical protein
LKEFEPERFGIVEKLDRIGSAGVLDAHGGLVHEVEVGGEVVGRGIGHKVWKKRKGID